MPGMNGFWIPAVTVAGCLGSLAAIAWTDARRQARGRGKRVLR